MARAGNLSGESSSLVGTQPSLGLLLAVEAHGLADNSQTLSGLLASVWSNPHLSRIQQNFGHSLSDFQLSPDGKVAAAVYADGSFQLWDYTTARPLTKPIHSGSKTVEVLWAGHGHLATYGINGSVQLWTESGQKIGEDHKLPALISEPATPLLGHPVISPDGQQIAVLLPGGPLTLWSLGGTQLLSVSLPSEFLGFAFTPDGTRIVVWTAQVGVPTTLRVIGTSSGADVQAPVVLRSGFGAFAFSPDGHSMVAGAGIEGNGDGNLTQVDLSSGAVAASPLVDSAATTSELGNLAKGTLAVAYSPDGRYVAELEQSGAVVLWNSADGSEVGKFLAGQFVEGQTGVSGLSLLRFTPDSGRIVVTHENGTITWDVSTRDVSTAPFGTNETPVAFAVDGRRHLLYIEDADSSGGQVRVSVWNSRTMHLLSESPVRPLLIPGVMAVSGGTGVLAVSVGTGALVSSGQVNLLRGGARLNVIGQVSFPERAESVALCALRDQAGGSQPRFFTSVRASRTSPIPRGRFRCSMTAVSILGRVERRRQQHPAGASELDAGRCGLAPRYAHPRDRLWGRLLQRSTGPLHREVGRGERRGCGHSANAGRVPAGTCRPGPGRPKERRSARAGGSWLPGRTSASGCWIFKTV